MISDDTLMAYADGELTPDSCAAVEAAMLADLTIAQRVAQHRALRARLQKSFAVELEEAIPERLTAAARGRTEIRESTYAVGASNAAGSPNAAASPNATGARPITDARRVRRGSVARRSLPTAAMAACLLVGVGLGVFLLGHSEQLIGNTGGTLVAKGGLANALSTQLGADRSGKGAVQIGLSFIDQSGEYCRVFNLSGGAATSGVACHHSSDWQIRALSQSMGGIADQPPAGVYRTAGSSLPPLILDAVRAQISGEPLDRDAESAARLRGWRETQK